MEQFNWLGEGLTEPHISLFNKFINRLTERTEFVSEPIKNENKELYDLTFSDLMLKCIVIRRLFDLFIEEEYLPNTADEPYKWMEFTDDHVVKKYDDLDEDEFTKDIAYYCNVFLRRIKLPIYELIDFDIIRKNDGVFAKNFKIQLAEKTVDIPFSL